MRHYELTLIVAPTVEDDDVQSVVKQVTDWIQADAGQVTKVDRWGRRQLAYPIQNFTEGTYVLLNAQLKPNALHELERNLKLDTNIIRYLLVRVED